MTDPELSDLVRRSVLEQPYLDRGRWFAQLEMSLVAYAGPFAPRAMRLRNVLEDLLIALRQEGLVRERTGRP